ncbi:hypothetical protein niasHT_026694 [Heterodera trifolii]|uniref:Uncharacterized protein n=1 Tax=Heterodera trifolii TaxID=157864 RepID=A0ABD2JSQ0_9BILA
MQKVRVAPHGLPAEATGGNSGTEAPPSFGWLRTDSLRRRREETAAPKRLRLFDNPRVVFRTPPWPEPRGFICGQQSDQTSQREPIGMTTTPP